MSNFKIPVEVYNAMNPASRKEILAGVHALGFAMDDTLKQIYEVLDLMWQDSKVSLDDKKEITERTLRRLLGGV